MFGIAKNIKSEVRVCTPELLNETLGSAHVAQVCAEIEDALEKCRRGELTRDEYETMKGELKKKLPVFVFHATFRNGRRKNDEAIPSGLCIYDLDDIPDPREKWAKIEPRKEELGIQLSHISPSLEGLRLVFVIPQGMSLAQSQAWMAQQLGDTRYDACVKDYARCSFAVPREYVLFVDEEGLFSPKPAAPPVPSSEGGCPARTGTAEDAGELPVHGGENDYPQTYEDIPYLQIVETLEEQMGGAPEHGSRNNFIFSMACHLRYVCNDDPEWIAQVLPTYGEARDKWMATIRSACARSQTKRRPRIVQRTLALCKERLNADIVPDDTPDDSQPPQMPTRLPALIKLLVSRTPKVYQPAVAHAVFPSLAAHLHRVSFRYIDNVWHEATLMNVLMAGTGAGKDCISEPINRIMADIRRRDEENLRREREWKKEVTSKGANKDKRERPQGLVIQEIDADMTNPAFVMRTAEADGHFLYTKMNEIDQFDALRGSGKGGQQFQIMCLAFDPGNRYGQTRVGAQSVTEKVTIRFNWNAATTVLKGQRYFARVLTDGPVSRINFCTIPEREIGADMPVYGTYDASFDEELRPYIDCLNAAQGAIECPQAFRLARKLKEENAEQARLTQDRVFENLSFRANVIAYLKACVLYVASGCRWDKSMEEFIRWSLQYDLWCKMRFFGTAIGEAMQGSSRLPAKGPRNLLELLPDAFTTADAVRIRQQRGMDTEGTRNMLYQWTHRGYILQLTADSYEKAPKYRSCGTAEGEV